MSEQAPIAIDENAEVAAAAETSPAKKAGTGKTLPGWFYKALIVAATVLWGGSFIMVKDAVDAVAPTWLISIRFLCTSLIMVVVFFGKLRRTLDAGHLKAGLVIGIIAFLAYWLQTVAITDTTPGRNAFLTATYCVMVPFMYWAFARKRPTLFNLVAAVLCIIGVGFVSLGDDLTLALRWGDGMTLVCAVFFGLHIIAVSHLAPGRDVMTLTVIQFVVIGVLGTAVGFVTEPVPQASDLTMDFWMQLGYLVLFASCLAMVFQNLGQANVPPAQCAILLSLESVFGVLFSVVFYGEQLTWMLLIGFGLIFAAILVSEALPLVKAKPHKD